MASKLIISFAEEVIKALKRVDAPTPETLDMKARSLLSGRTDEEVSQIQSIVPLHRFLTGLDKKTSGPASGDRWFPGSTIKLSTTVSELDDGKVLIPRSDNYEDKVREVPWESLQGGTIFPLIGDRTATGTLTHVKNVKLPEPVDLQGGKNYMRGADEGAWASDFGALSKLGDRITHYDNPYGVYTPMAGTGSDFAHMTTDVLHQLWSPKDMTKKGISAVNKVIRSIKNPKSEKLSFPNAPSIDSPEFMEAIEVNSPLRKAYIEALDKASAREQGAPDMGSIRHAITDPDLMHIPPPSKYNLNEQMMGFAATDIDPTGLMRPSTHRTYNTDLASGDKGYLGALPLTPRSVVMRDWTRMRRGETPSTYGDPRSLFTGPARVPQLVDQETIDAIEGYHYLVRQAQDRID